MRLLPLSCAVAVACTLLPAAPGYASLGGGVDTIQGDQQRLGGTARALAAAPAYTVHELGAPGGGVVREYTAGGTVFAVTWHGPVRPDLRRLLGQYFPAFQQAARDIQGVPRRRGPLVVRQPGLVVEAGGHMRDFFGRAYLPDRLPPGVNATDLQ